MTVGERVAQCLAVLACLTILAVPAPAGVLNGHPSAYNNGLGPGVGGAWSMTTSFDNGDNLSGTVDWAVFGPGDFPFDTGGDWTPTPGELAYAYQLFSTGSDAVSSYSVPVLNPAGNIGAFEDAVAGVTGILPGSVTLTIPGNANWAFSPAVDQNQSSGLAFSSPNLPEEILSIVVNGGGFAIAIPVPMPGDEPIPEPGTFALLAAGVGVLLLSRLVFRRQTK